MSYTREKLSD